MKLNIAYSKQIAAFMLLLSSFSASSFVCREELRTGSVYETRGVWVTRWDYTTRTGSMEPDDHKKEIKRLFKVAKESNLNTVFFQVRGSFDAYYQSEYEPWALNLSGVLGVDPGWDPLAFAIREAESLGLKLHAWVNTFTLWKGVDPPGASTPKHAYLEHPEWIVADISGSPMKLSNHYVYASPGNIEVREHILKVVVDIAEKYDVDGIHFDYIRYPEGAMQLGYSHDSTSLSEFRRRNANQDALNWDDWQRDNIHQLVRAIRDSVKYVNENIELSAAVLGKYRLPGWSGYDVAFQDAVPWIEEGWLDFIVPMIYTRRDHYTSSFTEIVQNWNKRTRKPNSILAGIAVYMADGEKGWGWKEIAYQIADVRGTNIGGMVFFNATALKSNWEEVHSEFFQNPALPQPLLRQETVTDLAAQTIETEPKAAQKAGY